MVDSAWLGSETDVVNPLGDAVWTPRPAIGILKPLKGKTVTCQVVGIYGMHFQGWFL